MMICMKLQAALSVEDKFICATSENVIVKWLPVQGIPHGNIDACDKDTSGQMKECFSDVLIIS